MDTSAPAVGVLALQGDVAEHHAVLSSIATDSVDVRSAADLARCTHLILPGGESTVIARMLAGPGLDRLVCERVRSGTLAVLGTCAGAILLATAVTGKNAPVPLGLMDITVDRNAYGTQMQSFAAEFPVHGIGNLIRASFIRAPVITRIGVGVQVLAEHQGHPVLVRSGNVWAMTCHPEVCGEAAVHRLFLAGTAETSQRDVSTVPFLPYSAAQTR